MKHFLTIALAAIPLTCASPSSTTTSPAPATADLGLSFATAIRAPTATQRDRSTWERIYLAHHYRGHLLRQRREVHSSHVYDIITIAKPDRKEQDIYFDITSSFGHF